MTAFPAFAQTVRQFEIVLVWRPMATIVLPIGMQASQGLGISRLSRPFLVGFVVTERRDRAVPSGVAP